jgi:protein TonB
MSMLPPVRKFAAIACLTALLAACSSPSVPAPAQAQATAVADVPVVQDENALRRAAAAALDEQRIHTPAGDSAIEHYLALRRLRPGDASLITALLELLPYALIASEQALDRGDLAEARRLVALIEQVDPQAPALARLRDGITAAEAESSRRLAAAAEAAKRQELLAAQVAAETAARATPRAASSPVPASSPAPTSMAPTSAVAASVASAPAPAAPAVHVPPPGQATPAAVAPAAPRLVSAPSPRYPLSALRRKIEGRVTVEFTVQPDGSVTSPRVLSADPAGLFDEAALAAAARWRFERLPAAVTTARIVQFRLGESAR